MKRAIDIIIASGGLIALGPLLACLALILLLQQGRPVLFKQRRVGRGGRLFNIIKFRTMRNEVGAESGTFEPGGYRRVTSVGRVLRKTKLDEVPQLWNVLIGDMSIVGPRPEVSSWVTVYPERWKIVHSVRPGITDPASIFFRDEEGLLRMSSNPTEFYKNCILPKKLDLYEKYVHEQTFISDLKIVFTTLKVLLISR